MFSCKATPDPSTQVFILCLIMLESITKNNEFLCDLTDCSLLCSMMVWSCSATWAEDMNTTHQGSLVTGVHCGVQHYNLLGHLT
jgi:hypothetical protein